jgi:signal transduction histidine kinase
MKAKGSITRHLALATGLWVTVGLGVAGWSVAEIAVRQVEATFDARLSGLLDAAVAAVALDGTGRATLVRDPAGADFQRPLAGAYWQVTGPDGAVVTSRSLWDQSLPSARDDHDGVLLRDAVGPRNEPLRVAERDVLPPGAVGSVHVAVALSRMGAEAEATRLRTILLSVFGLLGLGLLAGVVVTVVAGLAPLRHVRDALADVRSGRRERLDVVAPAEIAPLVAEIDALVATNRATVERARTHVGNLAHALKTPMSVLRNALDAPVPDVALARSQATALDRLVRHHLARARAGARIAVGARAVAPFAVADVIAQALRRLSADRGIAFELAGDPAADVPVDPQDLSEMLGNLMENASDWARSRVVVRVVAEGDTVIATISDDGPGLPDADRATAVSRGERLDERTPGSGLGLAIVADLAALYRGSLELGRSEWGGLDAILKLPRNPPAESS